MDTKTNNTTTKGKYFEEKAVEYLCSIGCKIIEQNYHAKKLGEIDIIAQKDEVYHFVEVKSGVSESDKIKVWNKAQDIQPNR